MTQPTPDATRRPRPPRRRLLAAAGVAGLLALAAAGVAVATGVFDEDPARAAARRELAEFNAAQDRGRRQQEEAAAGPSRILEALRAAVREVDAAAPPPAAGQPPELGEPLKAKLRDALTAASDIRLFHAMGPGPEAEREVHELMGDQYCRLGDYSSAYPAYERARTICRQNGRTLTADYLALLAKDATVYQRTNNEKSLPDIYREVAAAERAVAGEDSPQALASELRYAQSLAAGGPGELRTGADYLPRLHAGRKARLGPTHPETLAALDLLCAVQARWDTRLSIPSQAEYVALTKDRFAASDPAAVAAVVRLADTHVGLGQNAAALPLYRAAAAQLGRAHGPDDERTLGCVEKVATLLQGYFTDGPVARAATDDERAEAVTLLERVAAARTKLYGDADERTAKTFGLLASAYGGGGRKVDAAKTAQARLDRHVRSHAQDDLAAWGMAYDAAERWQYAGDLKQAVKVLETYLDVVRKSSHKGRDWHLERLSRKLQKLYLDQRRFDDAIALQKELVAAAGRAPGSGPVQAAELVTLGDTYLAAGRPDEAIGVYEQLAAQPPPPGAGPRDALAAKIKGYENRLRLFAAYRAAKRTEQATAAAEACYATFTLAELLNKGQPLYVDVATPRHFLREEYKKAGRHADVAKILKDDVAFAEGRGVRPEDGLTRLQLELFTTYRLAGQHAEAAAFGPTLEAALLKLPRVDADQLAAVRCDLAASLTALGRHADAAAVYARALATQAARYPGGQSVNTYHAQSSIALRLNAAHLAAGDPAAAAASLVAIAALADKFPLDARFSPAEAGDVYYALARSRALQSMSPAVPPADAALLRDRGLAELGTAVQRRFRDTARVAADPAWAALRDRDEYRAAVKAMTAAP